MFAFVRAYEDSTWDDILRALEKRAHIILSLHTE